MFEDHEYKQLQQKKVQYYKKQILDYFSIYEVI